MVAVIYIGDMRRKYNTPGALKAYLNQCTVLGECGLSEEIIYEVGGPQKKGFLAGLLETVNLPDVTIKPHPQMTQLILGTAGILALGAIGAVYINKNR